MKRTKEDIRKEGRRVLEEMEKSGGVGEKVQAILAETSTHVRVHAQKAANSHADKQQKNYTKNAVFLCNFHKL